MFRLGVDLRSLGLMSAPGTPAVSYDGVQDQTRHALSPRFPQHMMFIKKAANLDPLFDKSVHRFCPALECRRVTTWYKQKSAEGVPDE